MGFKPDEEWEKLAPEKREMIEEVLSTPFIQDDSFLMPVVDGPPGTGKTHAAVILAKRYNLQDRENQVILVAPTHFALKRVKEELDPSWGETREVARLTPSWAEADPTKGVFVADPYQAIPSAEWHRNISNARFLLCTPYALRMLDYLFGWRNPLVIFDEFSQIDASTFLMSLDYLRRKSVKGVLLFGDPLQLPVVSTQEDLHPNIVEFIGQWKPFDTYRLVTQYRMHDSICQAVNSVRRELSRLSRVAAGHELISSDGVRDRDMRSLGFDWNPEKARRYGRKYEEALDPNYPFVVIDTSELSYEEQSPHTGSWRNRDEVELVANLSRAASESFVKEGETDFLRAITPYTYQSTALKRLLLEKALTVHKAQGREYPFVIVSMARHNERADIGFIDQPYLRGLGYVAISRAMGKMIVLIAEDTFGPHRVLSPLLREGGKGCLKLRWKREDL